MFDEVVNADDADVLLARILNLYVVLLDNPVNRQVPEADWLKVTEKDPTKDWQR